MEQPIDERRALYDRFRADLVNRPTQLFYDEKELVEIFDQASDFDDDYVRMEVLLHGFRLYPESEDLKVRRAYFYSTCGIDDGVGAMCSGDHNVNIMWDILELRLTAPPHDDVVSELDRLIDKTVAFDDESIIQTVDCASALHAYDWIKSRLPKLRSKCSFLPTLLYEVHVVASLNGDNQYAISMLEELADIEPFNGEYWCMLAEEYLKIDQPAEAISATDYALAINADDIRAMAARARAIMSVNPDDDAPIALMERVVKAMPHEGFLVQSLAVAYINAERREDAQRVLLKHNSECPSDRSTIDYLLLLRYDNISDVLDKYYSSLGDAVSEEQWLDWANKHVTEGQYAEAAMILECYYRNAGIGSAPSFYFETLYQAKFYMAIVAIYEFLKQDKEHAVSLTPSIAITVVFSYLRLGRNIRALEAARGMVNDIAGDKTSISHTLAAIGCMTLITTMINLMESGEQIKIDDFDPFDKVAE
jgi:tetratricopeptide (TPR) repeat protein